MSMFSPIKVEDIGNAVQTQITDFDKKINSLSSLLSFGLNDPNYSKFFEIASAISTAIGGVCLAVAVVYTYIAIVKEGVSLRGDWKRIVSILLKLAIAKGLIDASTQFIMWIYSFPAKITQIIIQYTTGKSSSGILGAVFDAKDIAAGLGITADSGTIDKFVALQYAKIMGFCFFILSIIIFIIALARILKIYTLLAFSSLVFAKIPLYGFDGCKEYIKEMCALALQGGIIATSICLFEVGNVTISNICKTGIYGSLGSVIVLSISLLLLIFKSEELARKVV